MDQRSRNTKNTKFWVVPLLLTEGAQEHEHVYLSLQEAPKQPSYRIHLKTFGEKHINNVSV